MAMQIKGRKGSAAKGKTRYQRQLVQVDHMIEDPQYGVGAVGRNLYNDQYAIYFTDPVPSEAAKNTTRRNTMGAWARGVKIKDTYTVDTNAIIMVSDISYMQSAPNRTITLLDGSEVEAQVFFVQWISCWLSKEAVATGEGKDIFIAYVIAQSRMSNREDTEPMEYCRLNSFHLKGHKDNPMGEDYPVIFSFNDFNKLLDHVAADHDGTDQAMNYEAYMVRMVDDATGKIVGQGQIVSAYDYRDPDRPATEVFAYRLARSLGLTWQGLEQLCALPGYSMELYGLSNLTPSRLINESSKRSLMDEILGNTQMIPRNENGEQIELRAVPCALRGKMHENGTFWLDKCISIGRSGYDPATGTLSADSEIIDADSYSGAGFDDRGNSLEHGMDRIFPEFENAEGNPVTVDSINTLASIAQCEAVEFPSGQWSEQHFDEQWDNRPAPVQKAPAARPGAPRPGTKPAAAAAPAAKAAPAAPAKAAPATQATPAAKAAPAARPTPPRAGGVFRKNAPAAGSEDLGPAFPSEASSMDDVPF